MSILHDIFNLISEKEVEQGNSHKM